MKKSVCYVVIFSTVKTNVKQQNDSQISTHDMKQNSKNNKSKTTLFSLASCGSYSLFLSSPLQRFKGKELKRLSHIISRVMLSVGAHIKRNPARFNSSYFLLSCSGDKSPKFNLRWEGDKRSDLITDIFPKTRRYCGIWDNTPIATIFAISTETIHHPHRHYEILLELVLKYSQPSRNHRKHNT